MLPSEVTYIYDEMGNSTSITDKNGIASYTYDSLNQLIQAVKESGETTTYTYDEAGNKINL